MGFSITNPSSWGDPFVDAANAVADQAEKVARDAMAVAEIVGDGIVDGASFIGDGVITAGTGIEKWGITATGDAISWSKTSFADVRAWTEQAAGDVASFTVNNFNVARSAVEAGMVWVYQQLASFFYETLPELGPMDARAQDLAGYLLTEAVAGGLQSAASAAGSVITFGVTIKLLIPINIGVYVCGDGWGFFAGPELPTKDNIIQKLAAPGVLTPSVSAQVTMVFGPVSRASKAKAIKFGVGMEASPTKAVGVNIGGVVLMEASMPPLFLGLRYAMALEEAVRARELGGVHEHALRGAALDAVAHALAGLAEGGDGVDGMLAGEAVVQQIGRALQGKLGVGRAGVDELLRPPHRPRPCRALATG